MENNPIFISEEEFLGMYSDVVASGEDMLAWKCPGGGDGHTAGPFLLGDVYDDVNTNGFGQDLEVGTEDARLVLRYEGGNLDNLTGADKSYMEMQIAAINKVMSQQGITGMEASRYVLRVAVGLEQSYYVYCKNTGNGANAGSFTNIKPVNFH